MNDTLKKKRDKDVFIILIVIISIMMLVTIFGTVDYFRSTNGKKPIFTYRTVRVFNIDEYKMGSEDNALSGIESVTYYGMGYNVSICDNKTGNYNFQIGHKQKESCFTSLSCSETYTSKNDKHSYEFSFFGGKLYQITATYLVPITMIENEDNFTKEFLKYNDVVGVDASVEKIDASTYQIVQNCNIFNMSEKDIENVCLIDYFEKSEIVNLTKDQIDNYYYKDACK